MAKDNKTGQGIAALLKDTPAFPTIELKKIIPDPNQPRHYYDEVAMKELEESIRTDGVLQPILVRPKDNKLMIVFGERRFRAATAAGLKEIPAMTRIMTDEEALQAQIVENLQRKDVHPMEEAVAFKSLSEKYSFEEISKRVGKSSFYVKQRIKLNNLVDQFQKLYYRNAMTLATALTIAQLSADAQTELYNEDIDEFDLADNSFEYDPNDWTLKKFIGNLSSATFSLEDKELSPSMGACVNCQFNSAAASLFPDSSYKAKCNKISCFNAKTTKHFEKTFADAKEDPTMLFVVSEYNLYGNDEKKVKSLGVDYLERKNYTTIDQPDLPDFDEYKGDLENGDFDNEAEMLETYNKDVTLYNNELAEYKQKVDSGKYKKALVIHGDNKGAFVYIKISSSNSNTKSSVKSTEKSSDDKLTVADIDDEIRRLQDKEKRAKEIDENKIWDEVKVHFKPTELSSQFIGNLSGLEMKAIAISMYNKLTWNKQDDFRKQFKIDGRNKEFPTPDKVIFQQMQRFFFLDTLPPSMIYSGYTPEAKACLEIAQAYFPDTLNEIKLKQEEKAIKRTERVNKRVKELQTQKKELQAQQPEKKTKSKSK